MEQRPLTNTLYSFVVYTHEGKDVKKIKITVRIQKAIMELKLCFCVAQ